MRIVIIMILFFSDLKVQAQNLKFFSAQAQIVGYFYSTEFPPKEDNDINDFEYEEPVYMLVDSCRSKNVKIDGLDKRQKLQLIIDTKNSGAFQKVYYGFNIFLVNNGEQKFQLKTRDRRLPIVAEVLVENKWKPIEIFPCGYSDQLFTLDPSESYKFIAPIYHGEIQTKLRYKMTTDQDGTIYSNVIVTSINKNQYNLLLFIGCM